MDVDHTNLFEALKHPGPRVAKSGKKAASGGVKTRQDYEKAIERIEGNFNVRIKDRMPNFGE